MRKCPNCGNSAVDNDSPADTLCATCASHSVRVEIKPTQKKEVKKGKK